MKVRWPEIRVVSAEIQREGAYLITQRSANAVLPLLWEFPGGRVRQGEADDQALRRSCKDRIGVEIDVGEKLMEVEHAYDDYTVTLVVYRCDVRDGEPWAASVAALAWVEPEDFADYPFPGADEKTVRELLKES